MKIIAFTRLHYGLDYLEYVIRSTQGFADQHVILYTPVPTFGHTTELPNPDSREALLAVAHKAGGPRLVWYDNVPVKAETVFDLFPSADLVLELDADEVISPTLTNNIVERYKAGTLDHHQYRLAMVHHWRAFNYVCRNPGWPARLYLPKIADDSIAYFSSGEELGVIHHFGYCRRRADMEYKVALSVHLPEWRPGWWQDKYDAFPHVLTDVHPACADMWNAEPYDRRQLPEFMRSHPYYRLEIVE